MLERIQREENLHTLSMSLHFGAATMGKSMEIPQKTKNSTTIWPSCSTSGYLSREFLCRPTCLHRPPHSSTIKGCRGILWHSAHLQPWCGRHTEGWAPRPLEALWSWREGGQEGFQSLGPTWKGTPERQSYGREHPELYVITDAQHHREDKKIKTPASPQLIPKQVVQQ